MHMLEDAGQPDRRGEGQAIPPPDEAHAIYEALNHELHDDMEGPCGPHQGSTRIESVYSVMRGISGTPLDDSYHLGQTIVNDYGRPYENGFNNYSGVSGYATAGRFALYLRGVPGCAFGYGLLGGAGTRAVQYRRHQLLHSVEHGALRSHHRGVQPDHDSPGAHRHRNQGTFSRGISLLSNPGSRCFVRKQDQWLGPAQGASMAFSNNAQNFYAFEINRIEPLHVPGTLDAHRAVPL
jgi:hypothetical protein